MVDTLWYAALLAKLALAGRLLFAPALLRRYRYLCAWAIGEAVGSLVLMGFGGDTHSWDYAKLWSYVEWPLQALRALAVGEAVWNLCRQYGTHNRRFLCGASGTLSLIVVTACATSALVMEFNGILWNEPLIVQLTLAGSRVVALSGALILAACIVLLHTHPLDGLCPHARTILNTLAVWFPLVAVERYPLATMNLSHGWLDAVAVAILLRDIAMWGWLAYAVRPGREWDVTIVPWSQAKRTREDTIDSLLWMLVDAKWRTARARWTGRD